MKLIIGLGNPGEQYKNTRHNTGFRAIDEIADKESFKQNDKFCAAIADGKIGKTKVIFAKPQTFMNKSGIASGKIAKFYKIKKQDILIIYDDIDLMVGTLRLRSEGSSGGHKGMQSVIDALKTEKIARLKIGIAEKKQGKPASSAGRQRVHAEDYILKPPSKDAQNLLKKVFKHVLEIVANWINGEIKTTINL